MPTIIVRITRKAEVTIRVEGAQGAACESLTASLETALGKVKSRVATAEAFMEASVDAGLPAGRN